MEQIMTLVTIVLCSVIALLHVITPFMGDGLRRVLSIACIFLHTLLLVPLLLMKAEYELVSLIFLSSVLLYVVVYTVAENIKARHKSSGATEGEDDK